MDIDGNGPDYALQQKVIRLESERRQTVDQSRIEEIDDTLAIVGYLPARHRVSLRMHERG